MWTKEKLSSLGPEVYKRLRKISATETVAERIWLPLGEPRTSEKPRKKPQRYF
jgi:hypothetical protein